MAINLNDNIKINAGKPADTRYLNTGNAAYASTSVVNATIPISLRYTGLTANVNGTEYWYKNGVADINLIEKKYNSNIPTSNFITGATNLGYFSGKIGIQILPITHLLDNSFDGNYFSQYNYYYRGVDGKISIGKPSDGILKRGYVKTSLPVKSWLWNEYVGGSDLVGWILVDGNIADQLGTFQYSSVPSYYSGVTRYIGTSWTSGIPYNNGSYLVINTVLGSLTTGTTTTIGGGVFAEINNNVLDLRTIQTKTPEIITISSDSTFIYLSGNTGTGKITGATNGISVTGKRVKLGGALTGNTTIDGSIINNLHLSNINEFQVNTSGSSTLFGLDCNGILISAGSSSASFDKNSTIIYGADYSGIYTNRSLVDKGYVDALTTTSNNGITKSGVNYHLGGTLTGNTIISGVDISSLSLNCLSAFNLGFCGASTITDFGATGGLKYALDYSGNYTSRSIPDVGYVNAVSSGLKPKQSVNVATTTSISYPYSGLPTIDGVTVQNGWRVLVKDETSVPQQNGIWIASSGFWTRSTDFDGSPTGETVSGSYMWVLTGSTNGSSAWVLITPDPIYIGLTPLTFALYNQISDVLSVPGSGIDITMLGGSHYVALDNMAKDVRLYGITGATNGLTDYDGRNVCLGGTINSDTYIDIASGKLLQIGNSITGSSLNLSTSLIDSTRLSFCNPNTSQMGAINICSDGTTYLNSFSGATQKLMCFDYINGLQYFADYSVDYTNRTLVDKEYVDNCVSCGMGSIGATNGLCKVGNNITLGGTLTGGTLIDMSGNFFQVSNTINSGLLLDVNCASLFGCSRAVTLDNTALQLSNGIGNCFNMCDIDTIYSSTGNTGISYGADYRSNYTNRTLVDKEYVNNMIICSGSTSLCANNGLTKSASNIHLGGALTGNTRINGCNLYGLLVSTDSTQSITGSYAKLCVRRTGLLPSVSLCSSDVAYGTVNLVLSGITAIIGSTGYGFGGLKYANDNSTYFTKRSLPDIAYVTGLTGSLGIQTANNGLTKSALNVRLGGTLTGNTSIRGAYTLNLTGGTRLNTNLGYQISGNTILRTAPNTITSIFIGVNAGNSISTGTNNIAIGCEALGMICTGNNNIANGYMTLNMNVTGSNNIAKGYMALCSNSCGNNNFGAGYMALHDNKTGCNNIAIGCQALRSNTGGTNNIGNGYEALYANVCGVNNIAIGYHALYANTYGSSNIGFGNSAGFNSLGSCNVFLGDNSGYYETGSNKLYVSNSNTTQPLIYGDFSSKCAIIYGAFKTSGTTSLLVTPATGSTSDEILVWNSSDKIIKKISQNFDSIVNVCNVSAAYTTTAKDDFVGVCVSSIICLLDNPPIGQKVTVADIGSCALTSPISICSPLGINGNPSAIINTDYGSITFIYNGNFWSAVAFVN